MLELSFVLLAVWCMILGYFLRDIKDQLKSLQEAIKSKTVREKVEQKSVIIEPLTPEQEARRNMEETMRRLNS